MKWILLILTILTIIKSHLSHEDQDILSSIISIADLFDAIPSSTITKQCYINHYTNCTSCINDTNCQYIHSRNITNNYFIGGVCIDKSINTKSINSNLIDQITELSSCPIDNNNINLLQLEDLHRLAKDFLPNIFKTENLAGKVDLLKSIYSINTIANECRSSTGLGIKECVCASNGICSYIKFNKHINSGLEDCIVNIPEINTLISDDINIYSDCKNYESHQNLHTLISDLQTQLSILNQSSRFKSLPNLLTVKFLHILTNLDTNCSYASSCSDCLLNNLCTIYTLDGSIGTCLPSIKLPSGTILHQTDNCNDIKTLKNGLIKPDMLTNLVKSIQTDFIGSYSEKLKFIISAYQMEESNNNKCTKYNTCTDCLSSNCSYYNVTINNINSHSNNYHSPVSTDMSSINNHNNHNNHNIRQVGLNNEFCAAPSSSNDKILQSKIINSITECNNIQNQKVKSTPISSAIISQTALFVLIPLTFIGITTNWLTCHN